MPPDSPQPFSDESVREGAAGSLDSVLAALDYLVLEAVEDASLRVRGAVPDWFESIYGGGIDVALAESPFLTCFVKEVARPLWKEAPTVPVRSGIWTEAVPDASGNELTELHLEAIAMHGANGAGLLVIQFMGRRFEEIQMLTQRANEKALEHRQLSREVQKKDVLLRCIVHDLNNPLGAVLLNLELLATSDDEQVKAAASLALEAARRQRSLIKSITEVFSSDLSRLSRNRGSAEVVGEFVRGGEYVVNMHLNQALRRSVSILLEDGLTGVVAGERKVIGELEPFVRAVENLVLNALRYAPRDSVVIVRLLALDEGMQVQVEDAGPGVEPELVGGLFDPFTQGTTNRGAMGLGLYFCRMTVEQWGGSIVYEQASGGGARFVFTLPWAGDASQHNYET
ncbi:MAG: HAMP domain-containing sensor histidine kinase [Verrucomicrobia bacterium]|nr:HAMP domain-containing sensor histidine kinase [Verrucomicrobiota bacterium]